jgi:aspartate/methionine/tyrosine aminotransferase
VPDYTAYEDLLDYHRHRVRPVCIAAREQDGFVLPPERLRRALADDRLTAFVLSNPCNPTGRVVRGPMLAEYLRLCRESGAVFVLDEFYSHFIYDGERPGPGPVSGAAYVEDVERDPVLLVDGLTKSFRYPGWRVGWAWDPRDDRDAGLRGERDRRRPRACHPARRAAGAASRRAPTRRRRRCGPSSPQAQPHESSGCGRWACASRTSPSRPSTRGARSPGCPRP